MPPRRDRRSELARDLCFWILGSLLTLIVLQPLRASESWPLAITIDDVPLTGSDCDPARIESINSRLLAQLAEFDAPATAFVVTDRCGHDDQAAALTQARRWLAAGHELGNHSATHRDYNGQSVANYLADLDRATKALAPLWPDGAIRWFRPPLLHMGADQARYQALQDWLAANGQRLGVVTIDNQEWVYAAAWESATAADDRLLQAAILSGNRQHLRDSVVAARQWAQALYGRDIAQVLLLHANGLNAAHLDLVLADLQAAGARFVSLTQASADPAYASIDHYRGPRGPSWLLRWAEPGRSDLVAEPREAQWLAGLRGDDAAAAREQAIAAALDAANAQFSRGWVAGDANALAAAYLDDGILHPPAGGVLVGRAAITAFWERGLRNQPPGQHRLQATLRRVQADSVLELGRWHAGRQDGSGEIAWRSGCYSLLWQLDAQRQWRMAFDTWTDVREADWACVPRS